MVWTFWVWVSLLHLVQGREISYHSPGKGSGQACRPSAIAPGFSPTFSAAYPHAGLPSRATGLRWAARPLLGHAEFRSLGLSSAKPRAQALVVNPEVNPSSAITSLGGPDDVRGTLQDCLRIKQRNLHECYALVWHIESTVWWGEHRLWSQTAKFKSQLHYLLTA